MGSWRKDKLSCEDGALGRTTSGSADSVFRETLSRTPLLARYNTYMYIAGENIIVNLIVTFTQTGWWAHQILQC